MLLDRLPRQAPALASESCGGGGAMLPKLEESKSVAKTEPRDAAAGSEKPPTSGDADAAAGSEKPKGRESLMVYTWNI